MQQNQLQAHLITANVIAIYVAALLPEDTPWGREQLSLHPKPEGASYWLSQSKGTHPFLGIARHAFGLVTAAMQQVYSSSIERPHGQLRNCAWL